MAGGHANGGTMVHGAADQLRVQEVGAVTHSDIHGPLPC